MDNLSHRTDEQLVSLYVKGNNEAFDILLERYKVRLYTYISYSIHNADTAGDIFQETFVKAIMTLKQGRYKESGKFYPWLTRIAHNLIIDQFRAEKNNGSLLNDEPALSLRKHEETGEDGDRIDEQVFEEICHLVDYLPESQKEIVQMRIYQNLSFKEIAQIKGLSINTALGRMRYAILNMRRMANERQLTPYVS